MNGDSLMIGVLVELAHLDRKIDALRTRSTKPRDSKLMKLLISDFEAYPQRKRAEIAPLVEALSESDRRVN